MKCSDLTIGVNFVLFRRTMKAGRKAGTAYLQRQIAIGSNLTPAEASTSQMSAHTKSPRAKVKETTERSSCLRMTACGFIHQIHQVWSVDNYPTHQPSSVLDCSFGDQLACGTTVCDALEMVALQETTRRLS